MVKLKFRDQKKREWIQSSPHGAWTVRSIHSLLNDDLVSIRTKAQLVAHDHSERLVHSLTFETAEDLNTYFTYKKTYDATIENIKSRATETFFFDPDIVKDVSKWMVNTPLYQNDFETVLDRYRREVYDSVNENFYGKIDMYPQIVRYTKYDMNAFQNHVETLQMILHDPSDTTQEYKVTPSSDDPGRHDLTFTVTNYHPNQKVANLVVTLANFDTCDYHICTNYMQAACNRIYDMPCYAKKNYMLTVNIPLFNIVEQLNNPWSNHLTFTVNSLSQTSIQPLDTDSLAKHVKGLKFYNQAMKHHMDELEKEIKHQQKYKPNNQPTKRNSTSKSKQAKQKPEPQPKPKQKPDKGMSPV